MPTTPCDAPAELPTISHCDPPPVTVALPPRDTAGTTGLLLVDVTFAPLGTFSVAVPIVPIFIVPVVQVVAAPAMFAVPTPVALLDPMTVKPLLEPVDP